MSSSDIEFVVQQTNAWLKLSSVAWRDLWGSANDTGAPDSALSCSFLICVAAVFDSLVAWGTTSCVELKSVASSTAPLFVNLYTLLITACDWSWENFAYNTPTGGNVKETTVFWLPVCDQQEEKLTL